MLTLLYRPFGGGLYSRVSICFYDLSLSPLVAKDMNVERN